MQWLDTHTQVCVDFWFFALQLPDDSVHLCLGSFNRNAVLQSGHHCHEANVATEWVRIYEHRHPELRIETIVNTWWKDTNYCVGLTVHSDLLTDDVAVSTEMSTPQSIAEHYYMVFPRLPFFRNKISSHQHRQTFHREKTRSTI